MESNIVVNGDLIDGLNPNWIDLKVCNILFMYLRIVLMLDLLFMHFLFITRMTMDAFVRKYKLKLYENSIISTNGECRLWCNTSSKRYGQIKAKLPSGELRNFSPA